MKSDHLKALVVSSPLPASSDAYAASCVVALRSWLSHSGPAQRPGLRARPARIPITTGTRTIGMPYYNPGYAQYGFPGVGVSPWNPIVQAQLNLGLKTARYNMYSSWADQSNAAANLYYQQAMAQAIQNQQAQQALQPRYDVRTRAPDRSPPAELEPRPSPCRKTRCSAATAGCCGRRRFPSSDTLDKDEDCRRGGDSRGRQGV